MLPSTSASSLVKLGTLRYNHRSRKTQFTERQMVFMSFWASIRLVQRVIIVAQKGIPNYSFWSRIPLEKYGKAL